MSDSEDGSFASADDGDVEVDDALLTSAEHGANDSEKRPSGEAEDDSRAAAGGERKDAAGTGPGRGPGRGPERGSGGVSDAADGGAGTRVGSSTSGDRPVCAGSAAVTQVTDSKLPTGGATDDVRADSRSSPNKSSHSSTEKVLSWCTFYACS